MPEYAVIEAPSLEEISTDDMLAFRTPADITNIIGYMLYYKVYTGSDDYDDTGISDRNYFDAASYSNATVPAGENVPKQRGFFKMGQSGYYSLGKYLVEQSAIGGENTIVYIDFRELDAGIPPAIYLDADKQGNPLVELARGVRDNRSDTAEPLLDFYDDWDYNVGDDDDYEDSDLLRNNGTSGLLQYQPAHSSTDFENIRKVASPLTEHKSFPLFTDSNPDLYIAIAVHSYGQDFASGKLQDLTSQPIHLGYIVITQVSDKDRN